MTETNHSLLHDWLAEEDMHYHRLVRARQRRFDKFQKERDGWILTGQEMGDRINDLEKENARLRKRITDLGLPND